MIFFNTFAKLSSKSSGRRILLLLILTSLVQDTNIHLWAFSWIRIDYYTLLANYGIFTCSSEQVSCLIYCNGVICYICCCFVFFLFKGILLFALQSFQALKQHKQSIGFTHIFLQFFRQCKGNGSCVWKAGSPHLTSKFKNCDRIRYIFLISSLIKKSAALFYLANNSSKSYPHVEKWMLPDHICHKL